MGLFLDSNPWARQSFNQAMEIDGALGDAWLGRGLFLIKQGHDEEGRRDLQTAFRTVAHDGSKHFLLKADRRIHGFLFAKAVM